MSSLGRMPETTISFETGSIDARVEMRGTLASLRAHPIVTAVRRADVPPRDGRETWVVEHGDFYADESTESRRLRGLLRRLEELPPTDPELVRQTWERVYETRPQPPPQDFRESVVRRALEAPALRSALAQSMVAPLRTRLDYTGIGRRTFLVDPMPEGALPTYNRDVTDSADALRAAFEAVAQLGAVPAPGPAPTNHLAAHRVHIPEFEIASNPTINISEISQRRFSLIERQPPTPPPPWVGIGVYVRNKKDAEDLWVITGVDQYNVTMERWRGVYRSATVAFSSLTDRYEPCLAPGLPPTRFERSLEV